MPEEKHHLTPEGLVYVIVSPESGPQYRIYTDEDTAGPNAIEGIERELERQSFWFAQLGKIPGERVPGDPSPCGVTFRDYAFGNPFSCSP